MNEERELKRMRETEVATRVLSNPMAKGSKAMIIIGCNINHSHFDQEKKNKTVILTELITHLHMVDHVYGVFEVVLGSLHNQL